MTAPTPAETLATAELRAVAARERLSGTVARLQRRLEPASLVREVRAAGTGAAKVGLDRARDHPRAVAGMVGAFALFLARHRLIALVRKDPPKDLPDDQAA